MLRSMTGFGRGASRPGRTVHATAEVKSVNGRFAEVTVRAPRELAAYEAALAARTREALGRGSVTVHVTLTREGAASLAPRVNRDAAQAYAALLADLREAAGLDPERAPLTLDHLLRFPDVLAAPGDEGGQNATDAASWEAVQEALGEALALADAMRIKEGEALAADLAARAETLEALTAEVEARAPHRVAEARERLLGRLDALLAARPEARLAPERLEAEVALLADRLDVTEECVRLRSHLAQFREALAGGEAVGRRLNFLAQELGREVNTVASKANDPALAHVGVAMKEELEKVREQIQNVL